MLQQWSQHHPPAIQGGCPCSPAPCAPPTCSTWATPCQEEHALKLSSTVMLFGGPDATTGEGSTPRQAWNRPVPGSIAACNTQGYAHQPQEAAAAGSQDRTVWWGVMPVCCAGQRPHTPVLFRAVNCMTARGLLARHASMHHAGLGLGVCIMQPTRARYC